MIASVPLVRPLVHLAAAALALAAWRLGPAEASAWGGEGLDRIMALGLLATVLLYAALLPGPLYDVLPRLPGRAVWLHARRALGIDAAVLSGLHGWCALHDWVGGLDGLEAWSWDYQLSLVLGTVATAILGALALTSVDAAVRALGRWWKKLHRWVYFAGVLVVVHAATVTIHIVELRPLLVAWFAAVFALLALELLRWRRVWGASRGRALLALGSFGAVSAALFWSTFLVSHHRH